jgi:hypothetical protein
MGKMMGPEGQDCPLNGKDCSTVCHKCPLWREMDVTRGGKTKTEWDCSLAWNIMIGGVANARLDALTVSTQEMRNEFNAMKEAMGQLIVQIATAKRALPAPTPMRVIEHDTGNPTLPPYRITSQVEDGQEQRSNQS